MTVRVLSSSPAHALPPDRGWFSWNIARGTAFWSDSVYRLHGHQPGFVTPSSALTFRHKHPEDLYECIDALHAGMFHNRLIVHEHRLIDAQGQVRPTVMIVRPVNDASGRVRNLRGFLVATDDHRVTGQHDTTQGRGPAPLIPVLMTAFEVSAPAAAVMLSARRLLTARPSPEQHAAARVCGPASAGHDLRRVLEDAMFPLDHLTLEPLDLAA